MVKCARLGPVLSIVLVAGALAGCSGSLTTPDGDPSQPNAGAASSEAAVPQVEVALSARGGAVPVDHALEITAASGSLRSVTVTAGDDVRLPGQLDAAGAQWTASGRLEPGLTYVARIRSERSDGSVQRDVRRFSTEDLGLDRQTFPSIAPLAGETVGVGMPVIVSFDLPVADKAAFERHMTVTSVPAQTGAWRWISEREAHWRPESYWQADTAVSVDVDVNSLPAGNGIFGQESRHIDFKIGDAVISKVNASTHQMRTFVNGELVRTTPITTGKAGFTTRSGVKVIIEKFRRKRMDSETVGIAEGNPEYYNINDVEYAMRVTYSGEFLHAAPWSVGSQGSANVSHGCTGMSTANAAWIYNISKRGDVVEYVGTDRPMTLENGYGDWNLDFAEYGEGSAIS